MRSKLITLLCGVAIIAASPVIAAAMTLVEDGRARAVIVVPGAKPSRAANDLRDYVEKATGRGSISSRSATWVTRAGRVAGFSSGPAMRPGGVVDLARLQPEGFVIKSDGNDLFIVGRDTTDDGIEVDGTYYGVSEFLEHFVGVRWLMPGPLGEVIPRQPTLRVTSADIRQEPVLWHAQMRQVRTTGHREQMHKLLENWGVPLEEWEARFGEDATQPWGARQRLGSRVSLQFGHSYDGWWDRYHEQYPDIFALQPNGTRINTNNRERLCKSNPVLWELVAKEKIAELRGNPTARRRLDRAERWWGRQQVLHVRALPILGFAGSEGHVCQGSQD